MYSRPRISRTRRVGSIAMVLAVLALAAASLYGTVNLIGTAIGPGSGGTPRPTLLAGVGSASPLASGSIAVLPSGSGSSGNLGPSNPPSGAPPTSPLPSASATPKSGPFKIDLYRGGAFVSELTPIWCLSAAMQTSANIMDIAAGKKPDRTRARQQSLFKLSRSLFPAPDKAAEPEGWAAGLTRLGYGKYKVSVQPSIKAAIKGAAKALRTTNRPVGLMVWRGAHSWVMSGFTSTADPALTSSYTVTAVYIEDVWYPRHSNIWGDSRKPDVLVPVGKLPADFLPWKRPQKKYPDKDGHFVIVVPIA